MDGTLKLFQRLPNASVWIFVIVSAWCSVGLYCEHRKFQRQMNMVVELASTDPALEIEILASLGTPTYSELPFTVSDDCEEVSGRCCPSTRILLTYCDPACKVFEDLSSEFQVECAAYRVTVRDGMVYSADPVRGKGACSAEQLNPTSKVLGHTDRGQSL